MLKWFIQYFMEPEPAPDARQRDAAALDMLDARALADLPPYHPRRETLCAGAAHDRASTD